MLKRVVILGLVLCFFVGCQNGNKTAEKIAKIPISFKVDRFDRAFAKATPQTLPALKKKYPLLFPKQYADSVWLKKIKDTLQQELSAEVLKKYPDFTTEKEKLHALFQHLKYYFPDFEPPRVITLTNNVDFKNRVILADSLLLISLDDYLGPHHRFYSGIQQYIAQHLRESQILPDVTEKYAEHYISRPKERSFLAYMIYYGKILYFKDKMLPLAADSTKIGYTTEGIKWARANEKQIWSYFIANNSLYSTDTDLRRRFLDIGPFSRFGLVLDRKSPPRLGRYIGWQIVRQFADKHEDMTLPELLKMDNTKIFKESNYKPKQDR